MERRRLGRAGPDVSILTLGTGAFEREDRDDAEAAATIAAALDAGVDAVELDAGSSRVVDLLAGVLPRRGMAGEVSLLVRIDSLVRFDLPSPHVLVDQAYPGVHLRNRTEALLRAVGIERLGTLQVHAWCAEWLHEGDWIETCARLREEGKIAGVGVSLFDGDAEAALEAVASGRIDTVQAMYNPFDQTAAAALFPLCRQHGLGVIARSPLYFGMLASGSAHRDFPPGDWRDAYFYPEHRAETAARAARVAAVAPTRSLTETALRFALSDPAVTTVAVGLRNRAQLATALAAVAAGPLQAEERTALCAHDWLS